MSNDPMDLLNINMPMPAEPTPTTAAEAVASTVDPDKAAAALARLREVGGANFDKSALDKLKEKIAKLGAGTEKTLSGAEAPLDVKSEPEQDARVLTGRDVEWSQYDLDFNVAHLYPKAVFRETPQGPRWVAVITEFASTERDLRNHGKRVNKPGTTDGTDTEPLNLGEYLNDMVNGRDGWKIAAVTPSSAGRMGILLERQVPIVLPEPRQLTTTEEVDAPTDQELRATEDAALAFMAEQDMIEEPAPAVEETSINLRALTPEEAAEVVETQTDESGALRSTDRGARVRHALASNAPLTESAPVPKGEQPQPLLSQDGKVLPAAGFGAAADILRALTDENYRRSLPQE